MVPRNTVPNHKDTSDLHLNIKKVIDVLEHSGIRKARVVIFSVALATECTASREGQPLPVVT